MSSLDSTSHKLVVVPGGGPISDNRIGLPVGVPGGTGLLQFYSGQDLVQIAVFAAELPEVPPGHVAMADELASAWDFYASDSGKAWRFDPVTPRTARRVVLELPTEIDPGDAAREIARSGLAGTLLWVPDGAADVFLTVNGVPHRVREIDLGGPRSGLACLTRDTAVELYVSSVRAGVDIVVLADVSNSMTVDDLPADVEGPWSRGERWMTRLDALKRALMEMLDIRLQVSGRVSRLALVEFNEQARHKFPRGGGMAQLDGSSPEDLVADFRTAIALLRPSGGTNIGNALHEAANLLYQHGHPGNEKLIVLVSDGANWTPTGDQGTGEMVYTHQEPVSLVAHLHNDADIRLHAIGISTAELFHRRGRYQPNETIVPNHALLEELVKVGGGDPTTVGGLDVLADYFAGLGGGIVHRVGERLTEPPRPGPLPDRTRAALDRLRMAGAADWDGRRDELRGLIADLTKGCNDETKRVFGQPVWRDLVLQRLLSRELGQPITDVNVFTRALANGLRLSRTTPPFAALCDLLGRLASMESDYPSITALVGAQVDSPAAAQVLIMQRLHDQLGELHVALAEASPSATTDSSRDEPAPKSRYTYRE
ncbi:vWA domain-containing protein [Kutzneria kofuensis]|uniref:VWFA domain-containing protein n=1 Tax=Kutzneria kofuensis TaxID=103725 RepID=A0A7W9KQ96_9PSEU|nr:vWA domain-containing protein [Kutzneria kofuensis]MBB5896747.1 hypothetical protein [Kutzneria kofuensis]